MWLEELIAESERTKTQLAELEVSLQALKEENAMLRDGIREERAAVVAYLRSQRAEFMSEQRGISAYVIQCVAEAIERGDHRREEER